jgi:hypothetical protein
MPGSVIHSKDHCSINKSKTRRLNSKFHNWMRIDHDIMFSLYQCVKCGGQLVRLNENYSPTFKPVVVGRSIGGQYRWASVNDFRAY